MLDSRMDFEEADLPDELLRWQEEILARGEDSTLSDGQLTHDQALNELFGLSASHSQGASVPTWESLPGLLPDLAPTDLISGQGNKETTSDKILTAKSRESEMTMSLDSENSNTSNEQVSHLQSTTSSIAEQRKGLSNPSFGDLFQHHSDPRPIGQPNQPVSITSVANNGPGISDPSACVSWPNISGSIPALTSMSLPQTNLRSPLSPQASLHVGGRPAQRPMAALLTRPSILPQEVVQALWHKLPSLKMNLETCQDRARRMYFSIVAEQELGPKFARHEMDMLPVFQRLDEAILKKLGYKPPLNEEQTRRFTQYRQGLYDKGRQQILEAAGFNAPSLRQAQFNNHVDQLRCLFEALIRANETIRPCPEPERALFNACAKIEALSWQVDIYEEWIADLDAAIEPAFGNDLRHGDGDRSGKKRKRDQSSPEDQDPNEAAPKRRRPGRPPGRKNDNTIAKEQAASGLSEAQDLQTSLLPGLDRFLYRMDHPQRLGQGTSWGLTPDQLRDSNNPYQTHGMMRVPVFQRPPLPQLARLIYKDQQTSRPAQTTQVAGSISPNIISRVPAQLFPHEHWTTPVIAPEQIPGWAMQPSQPNTHPIMFPRYTQSVRAFSPVAPQISLDRIDPALLAVSPTVQPLPQSHVPDNVPIDFSTHQPKVPANPDDGLGISISSAAVADGRTMEEWMNQDDYIEAVDPEQYVDLEENVDCEENIGNN